MNSMPFDARTDWISYLRQAIRRPSSVSGLRDDVPDVASALADLGEHLGGTPLEGAFFDAVLTLVETGTHIEMDTVRALPYEKAPRSCERITTMLECPPNRLRRAGWVGSLLWTALKIAPTDSRLLAILRREALRPDRGDDVLELAARYETRWFAHQLPALNVLAAGHQLLMWVSVAPSEQRELILEGIARCGEEFVAALLACLADPQTPQGARDRLNVDVARHPAFRGRNLEP